MRILFEGNVVSVYAHRKMRIVRRVRLRLGRPMIEGELARIWWIVLLRAIAAVAFGALALVWPTHTARVLVALFGAYALVDGAAGLVMSARGRGLNAHAWLSLMSAVSLTAGVFALSQPRRAALVVVAVMGAWLIARGFSEILGEASVRAGQRRDWVLILNGSMSALFGIGVIAVPRAGGLGLIWALGAWAILHGLMMSNFALRLGRLGPSPPEARRPEVRRPEAKRPEERRPEVRRPEVRRSAFRPSA